MNTHYCLCYIVSSGVMHGTVAAALGNKLANILTEYFPHAGHHAMNFTCFRKCHPTKLMLLREGSNCV